MATLKQTSLDLIPIASALERSHPQPPARPTTRGTITVYFDGGCSPNPGRKYGSFEVQFNGATVKRCSRIDFGHGTNNEAEFESLISALSWVAQEYHELPHRVAIYTDSMIVVNRMTRRNVIYKKAKWKEASGRMFALATEALKLLEPFPANKTPLRKNITYFPRSHPTTAAAIINGLATHVPSAAWRGTSSPRKPLPSATD